MRILNGDNDKSINQVEIFLSKEEAKDFYYRLNDLANNFVIRDDVIFGESKERNDEWDKFSKEILFIALCTPDNLDSFSDRIRQLILNDK